MERKVQRFQRLSSEVACRQRILPSRTDQNNTYSSIKDKIIRQRAGVISHPLSVAHARHLQGWLQRQLHYDNLHSSRGGPMSSTSCEPVGGATMIQDQDLIWDSRKATAMLAIRAELAVMLFQRLKRVDHVLNRDIEVKQERLAELEKIRSLYSKLN